MEFKLTVQIDHIFRQSLSPTAQRADDIVRQIRQYETDYYWRVAGTPDDEYKERFAGEVFPLARPYIANTTLWKIVKRMPKGALLHAHLSAMLPYEKLVEIIIHTEGMMIASSQPVDTDDAKMNATITFSHRNSTTPDTQSPDIDSAEYVPGTKIPVTIAAANFQGGEAGFLEFIKMKTTVPPEESIRHELGVDEIWRRFQACFGPSGSMLEYEPVVRKFYQTLFSDLANDGINWVEIRSGGSSGKLVHDGQEDVDPNLDVWWTVLVEEINKFKATEEGKNFWGVRIIWSDARGKNRAAITKSTICNLSDEESLLTIVGMKIALQRKQNFPELFSGYDLVAQEDLGRSLSDLAPELVWFREQTEALNLTIPYFFHAGETLGDGNSTDDNLFDALLFNTRRIGHGFSLYKHPNLIKQTIEQNVLVEVCPISNEVLRLNTDILHHPLPAMIAHGIPTAISNDDPAILGQDVAGLSYDFFEAIQAFDNLGLAGLVICSRLIIFRTLLKIFYRAHLHRTVCDGQTSKTSLTKIGSRILTVVRKEQVPRQRTFKHGTVHGRTFVSGLWKNMRQTTRFWQRIRRLNVTSVGNLMVIFMQGLLAKAQMRVGSLPSYPCVNIYENPCDVCAPRHLLKSLPNWIKNLSIPKEPGGCT